MEEKNNVVVTETEINSIRSRLESNHRIRNDILTFSFATVIAALGLALGIEQMSVYQTFLLFIPFAIIIPFQARLSYYRLEGAFKTSFLKKHALQYSMLEQKEEKVSEQIGINGIAYSIISWLVNHELLILGAACCTIFWMKYFDGIFERTKTATVIGIGISLLCMFLVWFLGHATKKYGEIIRKYDDQWSPSK